MIPAVIKFIFLLEKLLLKISVNINYTVQLCQLYYLLKPGLLEDSTLILSLFRWQWKVFYLICLIAGSFKRSAY